MSWECPLRFINVFLHGQQFIVDFLMIAFLVTIKSTSWIILS